jgi:NodT family efflux transporter outer membrane factor (OMF) lipoprotein
MDQRFLRWLGGAGAAATLLAGCVLPPPPTSDEARSQALPNLALPGKWTAGPTDSSPVAPGWLALFNDPALEKLVLEAMVYNVDLQVAAARVEAAEANVRAAGGILYPQVSISGRGGGKLSGDASGLQGLGLFASWELDLWGRVRSVRSGATARYEATALDAAYARESVAALVAKSWFLAREATLQRAIATQMIESSQALAGLANERLRVGRGDEYEATTAEATVLGYRDLELQADMARQNAVRALEVLVGRYPSAAIDPGMDLPPPPAAVPVGLPSQILERRPDVRAAERRVAAAFYGVTEARAARLPRISLVASVSTVSSDLIVLKERDNPVWGLGATLLAPLFTGGALQAQVEVRTADQKAGRRRIRPHRLARLQRSRERALRPGSTSRTGRRAWLRSVEVNERSLGYARVRYDVGSGDQRGVQQQLLALHASRTTYVHVQAERLIQRVNLHLALGGGFEPAPRHPRRQHMSTKKAKKKGSPEARRRRSAARITTRSSRSCTRSWCTCRSG